MPQNTPRGYTYPCYGDANDAPAQLQDLATDIDTDVQGLLDNIDDARQDPPVLRIRALQTDTLALAAGALVPVTFTTEDVDTDGFFTAPGPIITPTVEGMYVISANLHTDAGPGGVRTLTFSQAGAIRAIQSRQASTSYDSIVNLTFCSYIAAGTQVVMYIHSTVAATARIRNFSMSRLTGATIL